MRFLIQHNNKYIIISSSTVPCRDQMRGIVLLRTSLLPIAIEHLPLRNRSRAKYNNKSDTQLDKCSNTACWLPAETENVMNIAMCSNVPVLLHHHHSLTMASRCNDSNNNSNGRYVLCRYVDASIDGGYLCANACADWYYWYWTVTRGMPACAICSHD